MNNAVAFANDDKVIVPYRALLLTLSSTVVFIRTWKFRLVLGACWAFLHGLLCNPVDRNLFVA